jgi:flagellar hook protein FlgE
MQLQAQGELQRTDQPLDLAFDGDGLLLVKNKGGTLGGARTGTFHITKESRLQDAQGLTLQGWPLLPGDGAAGSSTGKAIGAGVSTPGGIGGTPSGSASTESDASMGTAGAKTTKSGSIPAGSATQAPPPSAAFIGPLGALEDIQLIKPEPSPPPEAPDLSNPYGTGWSTQKEADGLYSFHGSAIHNPRGNTKETISIQRSFVDSLGRERAVTGALWLDRFEVSLILHFADISGQVDCTYELNGGFNQAIRCTFDATSRQMVVTFPDTGATVTFDLSDLNVTKGDPVYVIPEEPLPWVMPPMIFEEGTSKIKQEFGFGWKGESNCFSYLVIERGEDGSFVGHLLCESYGFDAELYFDEEGRVSGYKFLKNGNSTSDPSVGVEQTGSLVKGVHYVVDDTDTEVGTIDIDLSTIRILNRTGADLVINGSTIKPKASSTKVDAVGTTSTATAPLSPASLSIDERGVLSRLKDNGDWEPVYLLACGQFAAMNAAEEHNGVYYVTPASGALKTGVSGKGGMGTITAGTLERSTTDLAHELSEMIRAQHAYAANTKVLSTIDDMLTELERL